MRENNMTSVAEIEQLYVQKTLENVKALGAKYMIWQDPLDNGVEVSDDFDQSIFEYLQTTAHSSRV